jgi:hypothetical protein
MMPSAARSVVNKEKGRTALGGKEAPSGQSGPGRVLTWGRGYPSGLLQEPRNPIFWFYQEMIFNPEDYHCLNRSTWLQQKALR